MNVAADGFTGWCSTEHLDYGERFYAFLGKELRCQRVVRLYGWTLAMIHYVGLEFKHGWLTASEVFIHSLIED